MQRHHKPLLSAHSSVKESSLEGHGFYGALLCPVHCALLRREETQGMILELWEGTEVSKRHQVGIKLCSVWVLLKWQHGLDELGKNNFWKTFL